jgi:hypothetical protein
MVGWCKIAQEPLSLETPVGENAILLVDAAIQSNLRETTMRVLPSLTS